MLRDRQPSSFPHRDRLDYPNTMIVSTNEREKKNEGFKEKDQKREMNHEDRNGEVLIVYRLPHLVDHKLVDPMWILAIHIV